MASVRGSEDRPGGSPHQDARGDGGPERDPGTRSDRAPGPGLLDLVPGMAYRCRTDPGRTLEWVSAGAAGLVGVSPSELIREGGLQRLIHPDDRVRVRVEVWTAVARNQAYGVDYRLRPRDGEVRWVAERGRAVRDLDGRVLALEGFVRDVSEVRRLRERQERIDRTGALGRVTGAVAREVEELAGEILGALDVTAAELPPGAPARARLGNARDAAERALSLGRRLASFRRRRYQRVRSLDLSALAVEARGFLARLAGSRVDLEVAPGSRPAVVRGSPADLEQVLVHLVLDARDAVGDRGSIRISVEAAGDAVRLEVAGGPARAAPVSRPGRGPGPGTGGKGETALGLATVGRLVDRLGGSAEAGSGPKGGLALRVTLPRSPEAAEPLRPAGPSTAAPSGSERVVVVEEDGTMRQLVAMALRRFGYRVDAVRSVTGPADLERSGFREADLLITGVALRGWSGRRVARAFRERSPGGRVLFLANGVPDDPGVEDGELDGDAVLRKPFVVDQLLASVRRALDRKPDAARRA